MLLQSLDASSNHENVVGLKPEVLRDISRQRSRISGGGWHNAAKLSRDMIED